MLTFRSDVHWSRFTWLIVAGIFVTDISISWEIDIVFAYLLAQFLAVHFKEKSDVLLLTVVTTTLTVVGAVLRMQHEPLEYLLLKRALQIISFWMVAYFVIRFIVMRDVEEQLEQRFRALFQYATNGILLTNQKGTILMANPFLENLFGYTHKELVGKEVEVLIPTHLTQQHRQHRENYSREPRARSMGSEMGLKGLKKDGSKFPVEVSLSPFRNHNETFVVAFVVDNTSRYHYETSILQQKQELSELSEALKSLNEGLEQKVAERTAELEEAKNDLSIALEREKELGELKSRFVSMASHEFRTPLTTVLTSTDLLKQYMEKGEQESAQKHLQRIKSAVNGLHTILAEFLSLGRLEEGRIFVQKTPADVPACVEDVLEGLTGSAKTGQTFFYEHIGTKEIPTDGAIIKNILINFVSNAIKYSPEQKSIFVKTLIQNGMLHISVQDQGVGIPEAEQKYVFERFFRASNVANSTPGTGLGLHIVQRYADMLGGTVGFTSVADEGSTFWAALPVLEA
jgi:PAS domain S-box-containing protein